MLRLQDSFLCANDHVGGNAVVCDCGSTALLSLSSVLNRVSDSMAQAADGYREFLGNNPILAGIGPETKRREN
jgi:hypothetical protein